MGPNEWQVGRLALCSSSMQVQRTWTIRSRSDKSVGQEPSIETFSSSQAAPFAFDPCYRSAPALLLTPIAKAQKRRSSSSNRYHQSLHHTMHLLPSQYTCTACTDRLYAVIPHPNLHASTLCPQRCLAATTHQSHTTIAGLTCSRSLLEGAVSLHVSTAFSLRLYLNLKIFLDDPLSCIRVYKAGPRKRGLARASLRR